MQWARFEVISGLLDVILILLGVVLMVQFRVIKKTLKRQRIVVRQEDPPSLDASYSQIFSSRLKAPSDHVKMDSERDGLWEEEREREQKRFDAAIREVERMRSELSILISDVQRFLDDLTPIVGASSQKSPPSPPPPAEGPPSPDFFPEESMKERVYRLAREGRSIAEIAADVGRGEGEVAFLLAMEKVGRS